MEDDFDMAAAVSEVSEGMGFNVDDNEITEGEGHVDDTDTTVAGVADSAGTDRDGAGDKVATDDDAAATGTPENGTPAAGAPRTWRAEAAAEFGKLPPVVQAEILKREEDIFKGIEGYKESAAFGNSIKSVLDPYMPTLQQYGIQPAAQIADMMNSHYTLAFGTPEQKAALVKQVFSDYKLDPAWLGLQASESPVWVDPQVEALQKELQGIKSQLTQQERAQMEVRKTEIVDHVSKFASDPKNLYFDEVANDIAHLLKTGAETSVEKAYETAIWRNPAVRAKELTRQQTERAEAEKKAAAEKVNAARRATEVNVRSSAKRGSATTPTGSIDDTLSETLAKINARS